MIFNVTSCTLGSKNEDEELRSAEQEDMERRRLQERQRRKAEIERDADRYRPIFDPADSKSSFFDFEEYYNNDLWIESEFGNYDGYYEYGDPDGVIEGIVLVENVDQINSPKPIRGQHARDVEFSFHRKFPDHKASKLIYEKKLRGRNYDINYYKHKIENKNSLDVDVEAIYSVDVDSTRFIIVVEKGSQSTTRFMRDYERFILSFTTDY